MTEPRCVYAILYAPRERLEGLLAEHVSPWVEEIRHQPQLDSLFFVRFSEPRWQLRFRVFGDPKWIDDELAPTLRARAEALEQVREIEGFEFGTYDRELERYGGPEGMALAEQLFYFDSLAALDLIGAERAGRMARSRREWSILLVDRVLDLAHFDRAQRLSFYRHGYAWATELREWDQADVAVLERRFQELRPGLAALLFDDRPERSLERLGGEAAAAIAERFLADAAPLVERILDGHRAGRIRQDLVYLFWSYTHMFTNRLGIESAAEAVLRFFVHRLYEERPTRRA